MATKKKRPRVAQGTKTERAVLAVARVDYEDDRDGASFMAPEQRQAARRLAKQGYLRLLSDARHEVIAVLTVKGLRLIQRRDAARASQPKAPAPAIERANIESTLHAAKRAYVKASDAFQRAKRDGSTAAAVERAYRALGETSAAYAAAEEALGAYDRQHGNATQPTLLQQLMKAARGEKPWPGGAPVPRKKSRTARKKRPARKAIAIRFEPRERGNLVDVTADGRALDSAPAGGAVLRLMRGIVEDWRARDPSVRFDFPGEMKSEKSIVSRMWPHMYTWRNKPVRKLSGG